MRMDQPATPSGPVPINDVKPPEKTAEAPLAEPPKEAEFTEVAPQEGPVIAHAPPAASDEAETPAPMASAPAAKPAARRHRPVAAITSAVLLFIALAAVAYYAYTKSK